MNRSRQIMTTLVFLLPFVVIGLFINHVSHTLFATYHAVKASTFAHSGHLDKAVAEGRLAVQADPQFEPGHNDLGFHLFKQGKFAEAEVECRKAVSLAPNDAYAHDSLGQLLSHTGHANEAVQQCREAVQILPSPVHINSLAYALSKQGHWDGARQNWQQVTRMNNQSAAAEAQAMLLKVFGEDTSFEAHGQ